MKIRVEYNDEMYYDYPSQEWDQMKKKYGYLITVNSGYAIVVTDNGRIIRCNMDRLRVIDEEFVTNTITK